MLGSTPSKARESVGTHQPCSSGLSDYQHSHHKLLFLEVYDLAMKCCLEGGGSYRIGLSYKRVKNIKNKIKSL